MAGSVNKVILIGNVGKDPEVRHLENGQVVANITLATSEVYTDKSGQKREQTDWHDIVLWRGLAEITSKYVKKGYKLYVEGKLKKRSWQDKEGQTRYTIEVVADEMTILSRPESHERSNPSSYSNVGTPNPPSPIDTIIAKDQNDNTPF